MSLFGRLWLKAGPAADARGARDHRRRLVDGLAGVVLEVGAGAGLNFDLYPAGVTRVVAVEPDKTLRAAALTAAGRAPVPVEVIDGVADALPLGDAEADAVVVSLVLCTVPNQASALAEMHRVLRPGGELRYYEHVVPRAGVGRVALQVLDRSGIWPVLGGGCHPARDTIAAIEAAGFSTHRCERFSFSGGPTIPTMPHVLGIAQSRPA